MADNVPITAGTGTNISTDDVTTLNGSTVAAGTAQTQRVKVQYGDNDTARDASDNYPVPVRQRDANTGRSGFINTFNALLVSPKLGLINTTFFTTTSLTDQYTTTLVGSGTATVTANDGYFVLATGTTASSSVQINSKDAATFDGTAPLLFLNGLRLPQAGVAGLIRRWGYFDSNNGWFFEDNAGTLRVVARKGGVDTAVASGSFNGLPGTTFTQDLNGHFYQIEMTGGRAVFMVDSVAIHTYAAAAGTTTSVGSLNLAIRVEIIGPATATNYTIEGRGQNVAKLGTINSRRLNEGLLDSFDADLIRSVDTVRTAADTYATVSGTVVGAKTAADVAINGPIPAGTNIIGTVRPPVAGTGSITSVVSSATSVTVLAANVNRLGGTVFNDSTSLLYLSLSAGASSATAHTVQIAGGGYYELPNDGAIYTGAMTGIWATANGAARVTELTA